MISYFSKEKQCFVAAAKRPVPPGAVIPCDDVERNGRIILKLWSPEKLPEALVVDLDCRPKPKLPTSALINALKQGNSALIEATLRSSCEGSLHQALLSLSSGTSIGKEPRCENTIEQILGNIERSNIGERKMNREPVSPDSYEQSKRFSKQFEDNIFGSNSLPGNFAQNRSFGANMNPLTNQRI